MQLARVIGAVVATVKDADLAGKKLLILAPLGPSGQPNAAASIIALDAVGAGVGELVYFSRGREASLAWERGDPPPPTDAAVVGIADPAANPALFSGAPAPRSRR
jgi:ethanolamine utilization protein EutN